MDADDGLPPNIRFKWALYLALVFPARMWIKVISFIFWGQGIFDGRNVDRLSYGGKIYEDRL